MFLVVCYDITDDRRRTRIRKALRSYGEGVQESVFEAEVDARQMRCLHDRIEGLLEPGDRVRYYMLCEACVRRIEGTPGHPTGQRPPFRIF